jgi:hypothetical protein
MCKQTNTSFSVGSTNVAIEFVEDLNKFLFLKTCAIIEEN